ncbi:MAG TPA: hypothetical protein VHE11_03660, partial [Steroidobacteraceae bacterium]|nr:hypothetical protein [Steroidobacteraceae bacterium]
MIWFLSLLLIAACGFVAWPALRRALAPVLARAGGSAAAGSAVAFDLRRLPDPPLLQAASAQFLDCAETFRRLRSLELGLDIAAGAGRQDPAHDRIVAAALAAIGDPATRRHYFPRRPNLLPELIRAIN